MPFEIISNCFEKITGLLYRVVNRFRKQAEFKRVALKVYRDAAVREVRAKLSATETMPVNMAIGSWLFDDNQRAQKLIDRNLGLQFYRPQSSVVVTGRAGGPLESIIAVRRPLIEVIVDTDRVYVGFFCAYADGDRKTDCRYRIYSSQAQRRFQFRYVSQGEYTTIRCRFRAVSYHDSEFSYYKHSPLATFEVLKEDLPDTLQALLPIQK